MVAQPFDRRHLPLPDHVDERDAGERGDAVELDCAGAAVALVAGDLRPGQAEILAQHLRERPADRRVDVVAVAVDRQRYLIHALRALGSPKLRRGSPSSCPAPAANFAPQPRVVTATMSARWMSRNVARVWAIRSRSSPSSGSARHIACAASSSSRICSSSSRCPFERSLQALRARPSTPTRSGWRVQSSGVAIERYWWIRAKAIGCEKISIPSGGEGSRAGSPAAIRRAL